MQVDEIWTFVKKKEAHLSEEDLAKNPSYGDQYLFVALDPNPKLVPAFIVGKRNKETAMTLKCYVDK